MYLWVASTDFIDNIEGKVVTILISCVDRLKWMSFKLPFLSRIRSFTRRVTVSFSTYTTYQTSWIPKRTRCWGVCAKLIFREHYPTLAAGKLWSAENVRTLQRMYKSHYLSVTSYTQTVCMLYHWLVLQHTSMNPIVGWFVVSPSTTHTPQYCSKDPRYYSLTKHFLF